MAIVKMKKLRLMAVRSQKEELLEKLMLLGCVQITDMDEPSPVELAKEAGNLADLKDECASLGRAKGIIDSYTPPPKKGLLSAKPEMAKEKFLSGEGVDDALELARKVIDADAEIRSLTAEESRQRGVIDSLTPWADDTVPLDTTGTERCVYMMGMLPASAKLNEVEDAVASVTDSAEIFKASGDRAMQYVSFVCLREDASAVLEKLRSFGFAVSPVSGMAGTAKKNIAAAEESIIGIKNRRSECEKLIEDSAESRQSLILAEERMNAMISRAAAGEKLGGTESAVVMKGWVPAENEDELADTLAQFDCAWETEDPSEDEYADVPVKLKNNKFTNSLNMVTNMYSLPAYGTVDPNPVMAPFFILFFGLMMADMGYGILMAIAAIVAMRKIKPRGGSLVFCQLLLYCGISTFLMGILTGGFFSDIPYQLTHIINPNSTWKGLWSLFSPETDSEMVLYGSMVLGVLHLNAGMVVNFLQKKRSGDLASGIFEEGSLWVILVGGVLAFLKIGSVRGVPVVLIIGIAMLLFGAGRGKKGFGKLTAAFGCIYNTATGWFGDVLSYSRIMALMLAGGVIGKVFNTVALMPMQGSGINPITVIAFIVIFLLGHAMNFGLNMLGCFVHDLRLQCLEFFGKFYADGGKPFSPLKVSGKFINTKEN